MTLETALILLGLAVVGIVLTIKFLHKRPKATPHNYPMIIRNESTFSKCIYQP